MMKISLYVIDENHFGVKSARNVQDLCEVNKIILKNIKQILKDGMFLVGRPKSEINVSFKFYFSEIEPYFPERKGGKCFFPFRYKDGVFYDCVKMKAKHKWCSLTHSFKGYWKYCSEEDLAKCIFPFWFKHMIYWECTEDSEAFGKKWCSLTQNYNKERVWKYC
ncbi:PREDICTED: binder of sperm protein homolog 1-like [Miniopterus natalensis]|uniref:binder of sperm protein homolog 1-like n=1 Tax=Miniopterus natalensis TaxID=291302 RepID=UPI0007A6C886|nr:PREDICTED: binder of sperm protein homolog 1-like [Miniopterus natalensis]